MEETGRAQSKREITKPRKQDQAKTPVKENVRIFEGTSESPVKKFEGRSLTPEILRSKAPIIDQHRPSTLFRPTQNKSPRFSSSTRSKSPGLSNSSSLRNESPRFSPPVRSTSPGVSSSIQCDYAGVSSPIRSKSLEVVSSIGNKSPIVYSLTKIEAPTYGSNPRKSPGYDIYNQRKSPEVETCIRSRSLGMVTINRPKSALARNRHRSKSPGATSQSSASSPTTPADAQKWSMNVNGWSKESPLTTETTNNFKSTPDGENQATIDDTIDISWYFDNIEYVADSKADQTNAQDVEVRPGSERSENLYQIDHQFRNSLTYNIGAWNNEEYEEKPKKADDFIQRLCHQVRNHVEYLCGVNFINYKAVSYKVRIAGEEGICYYVKVNVWQNYCLHLRIFSRSKELDAVPVLQAILERAQRDNGNIEFF